MPVFEKAFETAEYVKYSPAMQEAYQNNLKMYRDNRNVVETAYIDGETHKALEIARNMKKDGVDPSIIAKYTGLSPTEIERLN